ncbi:BREX-1 system phosphatase PglZ type A [Marispirochaeta aestuarii]|uniref:BREX-1 system phosphatase PglZ type A n=1 Tax=Marispirochaeta aestuarii TaxID=1963862 RepID=UPI0029C7DDD5|nr:BREX-1 system phosphatase PglZ type A [Marispirochaeta aestuarii]
MNTKLQQALDIHFKKHRLIFWFDEGAKMRDVFEAYQVPEEGLKLEVRNNEFKLRHLVLKEKPEKRVLLYSPGPKPPDRNNWLLDLQLAGFVFASDQAALVLQELELAVDFLPLVQEHIDFFANRRERLEPLRSLINPTGESFDSLKTAMLSVLCGRSRDDRERRREFPEMLVRLFLDSFVHESGAIMEEVEKFKLDSFLYEAAGRDYGYTAENANLESLLHYLLSTVLDFQLGRDNSPRARLIYTLIDTWRKHQDYSRELQELLDIYEKKLNIPHELSRVTAIDSLANVDLYKEADRRIFSLLLEGLLSDNIESSAALDIIEARRETYWYKSGDSDRLVNHYRALYYYLLFRERLSVFRPDFHSLAEGFDAYRRNFCILDGDYRRFLNAVQESDSASTFSSLLDKLEREYTEAYLQPLADSWQAALDADPELKGLRQYSMGGFFKRVIEPYLKNDRSVFVIISDGLRYEIGAELSADLQQKSRFQVELSGLIAPQPSYTQLGMASLLPHSRLSIADDGNLVFADGQSTMGLENRQKIIQAWVDTNYPGKKVRALQAGRFLDMPRSEQSDFIRGIDLVFLYSAGVDSVGDDQKTELRLPKAASDELRLLENLCSHIGKNLSRTHILVTADHGFLFRYREVPDTERTKIPQTEGEVRRDHRFIFSPAPKPHAATDIVKSDSLEWSASFSVQFARGVNRFRRPGGGTRYVHGGRMPQELIVPLLAIRRTRTDDVSPVDIAVVDRQSRITSGQITVSFLQEDPAKAKQPAREIEAVFESSDGKEISNKLHLIFDSDDPVDQNRARKMQFIFTREADSCNGTIVYLKLYDVRSSGIRSFYKEYSYRFQKTLRMEVDF